MITKDNFKDLLLSLGFVESSAQILTKTFKARNSLAGGGNNTLKADFKAKKLIYPANTSPNLNEPNGIIIHDDTTSNFSHPENFVVFECVHRLLDKGYKPEHIELEPKWKVGGDKKGGKADILVRDNERNPYLLIECKTAGSEFTKEWNKMQQDGGQLFSYFQQERGVKFLCLYTSDLAHESNQDSQKSTLNYQNFIIPTQDNKEFLKENSLTGYAHATNNIELFEVWREVYKLEYAEIGIFERNINAYEAGKNALCFDDLQELSSYNDEGKTYEDGKYHEFAKILRKYNISGKENAFDKLVNLFLCKIYDENHNKEILRFCYRGNASDSIESMQDRLMLLYKEAMKEFLGEEITYVSDEQINAQFSDFTRHKIKTKHLKTQMQEFIRQLKFYSHSDFSFLEVHNKELFLQNGEVLKAVVKLFEKLKLTQNKTNQLLGNLFELFLQKGMKQDEGQFFTPMPICEFIIHSLPLDSMLTRSNAPKVIDYACGAGHFLNTYANIIAQKLPNDLSHAQRRERLDALFSQIHGIEKEYRLSKVAKVAAAMFSQEKINITYADALDSAKFAHKDFDLLISNPPYSVKGFAETLNKAFDDYELSQKVSDKDSFNAIECFFIERANALLASNAKLAIVLPSSILNKGGIYENTREIILRNFNLIAIVELGSATFGATGTNTIILFATKRETYANSHDSQSFLNLCENITDSLNFENVYLGQFLREYCAFMEYKESDFSDFVRGKLSENLAQMPTFCEYKKAFLDSSAYQNLLKSKIYKDSNDKESLKQAKFTDFALEIEKDKLLYFALNYQNEVLIIKSPSDIKEQKKFLGYEWSNRKGDEGLKELNSPYTTPLFDRANPNNPHKLNTLIKNAFLQTTPPARGDSFDSPSISNDTPPQTPPARGGAYDSNAPARGDSFALAEAESTCPPSLAEGARGWVKSPDSSLRGFEKAEAIHFSCHTERSEVSQNPQNRDISPTAQYDKMAEIPPELQAYALKARLVDMLDFTRAEFSKAISLNPKTANKEIKSQFEIVKLESVGEFFMGGTPSRKKPNYWNGNIKWLTIGDYSANEIIMDTKEKITQDGLNDSSAKLIKKGAVVVSIYATIGRVGILGADMATNQAIVSIIPNEEFINKYLMYAIDFYKAQLFNEAITTSQKNVNLSILQNMKIPKPPLEIQRQIISECESVESQSQLIKDLIALYRDLVSAVLAKCGISEIAHPLRYPSAMKRGQADLTSAMEGESHLSLRESALADSWQSMNPEKIITALLDLINTLESKLKILPTPKSPPQGRGLDSPLAKNTQSVSGDSFDSNDTPPQTPPARGGAYIDSPSLAEGVRGWVESPESSLRDSRSESKQSTHDLSLRVSEASVAIHESKIDCHDLTSSNLAMTDLLTSLPTPPKNGWDKVALSNSDIFELTIGERVLDSELHEQGKIPVYSANVTKPFGFIDKELLDKLGDYDRDSVLWGIDGDFMIGFVPKNTPFYPTDHCGVLRVKDKGTNVRIAGFGLENEGRKFGFSRNLRASIGRIKSLKIPLPPLSEQEKIISCIEAIESKITALDSTLPALELAKSQILQKYL